MPINLKSSISLALSAALTSQVLFFGFNTSAMAHNFDHDSFASHGPRKPSYDRLMQAKARLFNVKQMIEILIAKADGQNPDDRDDRGDHDRDDNDRDDHHRNDYDRRHGRFGVLENDFLAKKLLVRINLSLEDLAEKMDQATAVYHDNALFWHKQKQVCILDRRIYKANQGAKTASQLPRMGLLSPSDFQPIDQELMAIEDDFGC